MPEARQLKAGRWRIYTRPDLNLIRDPQTGSIATFDTLDAARRWWRGLYPGDPPLQEALKCARCGGYFGPAGDVTEYAGRHYHRMHAPQVIGVQRRR